jgi:hypothetical protein
MDRAAEKVCPHMLKKHMLYAGQFAGQGLR